VSAEVGSQAKRPYDAADIRILVLGGGFAGHMAARTLAAQLRSVERVAILLVNRDDAMLYTPLLWKVAAGEIPARDAVIPYHDVDQGFAVLTAEVEKIDLERRQVRTSAGVHPYDVLVVALGSVPAVPDLSDVRRNALTFHTLSDAVGVRARLRKAVEAARDEPDPAERRALLTAAVVGGGDTGVELAATMREYLTSAVRRRLPGAPADLVRVVLLEREARLMPFGPPAVSATLQQILESQGVEIRLNEAVTGVEPGVLMTSRGAVPARTIVWATGVRAPDVVRRLPGRHAVNGAVLVDSYLRLPGYPDVYVIGDAAAIYGRADALVPATAQAAEGEGRYAAMVIARALAGYEIRPYRYTTRGHLTLLGRRNGLAEVGPATIAGLPAWLLWHGYYLSRLPAGRRRASLATDLALGSLRRR